MYPIVGTFVNEHTIDIVKRAGIEALRVQLQVLTADKKTNKEGLVTAVDLAVSKLLDDELGWFFGSLSPVVVDEEKKDSESIVSFDKGFFIVRDPIDGSENCFFHALFRNGLGESTSTMDKWVISIGFVVDGVVVAGIVYQASTSILICAERGHGAFMNGRRLSLTSYRIPFSQARCVFDYPWETDPAAYQATQFMDAWLQTTLLSCPIRYGSCIYEMMQVVLGKADFFFHLSAKTWDYAGMVAIFQELGYSCWNAYGERYRFYQKSLVVSCPGVDMQPFYQKLAEILPH